MQDGTHLRRHQVEPRLGLPRVTNPSHRHGRRQPPTKITVEFAEWRHCTLVDIGFIR